MLRKKNTYYLLFPFIAQILLKKTAWILEAVETFSFLDHVLNSFNCYLGIIIIKRVMNWIYCSLLVFAACFIHFSWHMIIYLSKFSCWATISFTVFLHLEDVNVWSTCRLLALHWWLYSFVFVTFWSIFLFHIER